MLAATQHGTKGATTGGDGGFGGQDPQHFYWPQWGHFSQYFSTYRWQHDVIRSNHVICQRDYNILLLGTTLKSCVLQIEYLSIVNVQSRKLSKEFCGTVIWIITLTTGAGYHRLRDDSLPKNWLYADTIKSRLHRRISSLQDLWDRP